MATKESLNPTARTQEHLEEYYRRAQRYSPEQRKRRDLLAGLGANPVILRAMIAGDQLYRRTYGALSRISPIGYDLDVIGCDVLPKTGAGMITTLHQDGEDASLVLETAVQATKRQVKPLVEIDSGQSFSEYAFLELFDVTYALRGDEPLAKKRQAESYDEMLQKALAGDLQAVWSEGTFCPQFDDVLRLYNGGSTKLPREFYRLTGQKMLNYPEVTAYEFDRKTGEKKVAHMEYLVDPFDATVFSDAFTAADALREILLKRKKQMYDQYMPDLTPAEYSRFRAAGARRHPHDPDYYNCGRFSLNFREAQKAGDEAAMAAILAMFDDRLVCRE